MVKMSGDDVFRLYERLYFWEIERRDRIDARVPVIIVLVLALVSLQSYLLNKLLPLMNDDYVIASVILLGISLGTLIVAIVYLLMSWHGHDYAYLPNAMALEDRRDVLRRHLDDANVDDAEKEDWLAAYTSKDLFEYYVECGSLNFDNNNSKSTRLYVTFNWLIGSIVSGIISFALLIVKNGIWTTC